MTWICVIDADADLRDALTDALRDAGHGVRAFGDGQEALDAIASALEPPRLVTLDLFLPNLGAREVLQRIRTGRRVPTVPVLVITAADVEASYFAPWPIAGILRKPMAIDALLAKVAAAIPSRKRSRKTP